MIYQVYENYKSFLNKTWAWILGSLAGIITGINAFPMKYPILDIDVPLLLQYLKLIFFAISGGAATNAGKWLIDYLRERRTKQKTKRNTRK